MLSAHWMAVVSCQQFYNYKSDCRNCTCSWERGNCRLHLLVGRKVITEKQKVSRLHRPPAVDACKHMQWDVMGFGTW